MTQPNLARPVALRAARAARSRPFIREETVLVAVVALALGLLALVPIIGTLFGSVWSASIIRPGGHATWENWPRVLGSRGFFQSLGNSVAMSLAVTIGSIVIGSVLALLLARTDLRFGRFIRAALYGNMMVSPFVIAAAWVTLASPRAGLLNYLPLTLADTSWVNVYTFAGLVFVIVSHLAPFVVAFLLPAFANFDSQREEAASVAGASTWTIVRTVTLPLTRPAIVSVAITVFVLGIEMFSIPSVIAANNGITLLAVDIYKNLQFTPSRWQDSAVIGVVLIAIVGACLYVQRRVVGDVRRFVAIGGKGNQSAPLLLAGRRNPISFVVLAYVVITCVLPLLALVFTSFSRYAAGIKVDLNILTLDNFATVLRSPTLAAAILNSAKVGLIGAVGLIALGVLTSVAAHGARPGRRAAEWLDPVARLPIALPGIVLGIGLLWAYFLVPLPIYGTLAILVIAAITKFLPIVYGAICAAYLQLGSELREAGLVAGAGSGRILREVEMPILSTGLLATFFYALLLASQEANASIMVYSSGSMTLPILLWATLENAGSATTAAVVALASMALTGSLIILGWAVGERVRPRWRTQDQVGPLAPGYQ